MKTNIMKCFSLALALLLSATASAQEKKERTIHVVGTAEMEIVPDEIHVTVTLKEYIKDKKKHSIEELEKGLVNFLTKTTGIAMTDIKMDNMNAYIMSLRKKNKEEIISKSYDVKFKSGDQVYQLYSVMDSLGVISAPVSRYSHSKMEDYKKQVKINAIKAARDKASYLLEAIGSKAGKPVSVIETDGLVNIDDGTMSRYLFRGNASNSYSQSSYKNFDMRSEDTDMIGGKTIKIRYDITAEFEIVQ